MNIKIFFCLFAVFACAAVVRADESTETSSPTQQLQGFNLDGYNNNGQKTWNVNGSKADITDSNIQITNVDANFYGKQQANLKADHGTINKTSGDIHLRDHVVITSDNRGTQMTTDALDYNRNKDLVTTPDPVKIVDPQGVVTGQGLVAHPNLRKARIKSHVKAVVHAPKSDGEGQVITITSDGPMQMNQAAMYAVFTTNVVAVEASTGRELHCDKMEIWFNQATKKIKKAICTGHVKVIQGPNVSYADKMIYDGDTQVLTMIGRPKIVFDTGSTKGNGMFQPMGK
ncbi:MAG: LPS export ABC transporter periplasmic protein LptC [Candidatus Omnitrophica bacterium]|nr:LPS export ABC transporter periplasmic protein LptC [Candidatus Omnitrophota bacterium]MDE2009970.1 LPS export ABC transporter periplasmic protein LptC [Candidatus Omnitrophota bacterium]MDE2213948.1 LPS export ABC transporter periplasmic protein LptC [Candidatus Omnitrophota bacterium]MDE2231902.1 LPS export ABC transporter periplasmic protein LptC [Candidatus Omnitrophota bacterium]